MALRSRSQTQFKKLVATPHGERSRPDDPLRIKRVPVVSTVAKAQTATDARRVLAAANSQLTHSLQLMKVKAHSAGALIAQAAKSGSATQRQQLLSKAYDERTTAELAKHAAAYAQAAQKRITTAISVMQSDAPRAKGYVADASSLLAASDAALASGKSIPQPAVLQFAKTKLPTQMQELTLLGVEKTAAGGAFSKKKANSLFPNMPMYWPDDVQKSASGALGDYADPSLNPQFQADVSAAFGTGIAGASSAAASAARDATKDNPTASAFVSLAGQALATFGVQLDNAQQQGRNGTRLTYVDGGAPVPWTTIALCAGGLGVLYLVLK